MFREKIKVLDCTIRDGGLINNHDFDRRFVRAVYQAISEAGVDYVELGYKNSKELFSPKEYGLWKFCLSDRLSELIFHISPNLNFHSINRYLQNNRPSP